ncbi:hypothetical protein ACTPEF_25225, partial [Clostridioides difficile]
FATAGSQHGGGELALQAMNIFAQHMGMTLLSVPCSVRGGYPADTSDTFDKAFEQQNRQNNQENMSKKNTNDKHNNVVIEDDIKE